jgi:hypothetical protein
LVEQFGIFRDQHRAQPAAGHRIGATSGVRVNLGRLPGTLVLFCYPILHVFYPVFPPDQSAERTLAWVGENRALLQANEEWQSSEETSGRIGPA